MTTTQASPSSKPNYPLAAFLNFCPGGITYAGGSKANAFYNLASYSPNTAASTNGSAGFSTKNARRGTKTPDVLVHKAKMADDRLRQYMLLFGGSDTPHYLPSLSVLAHTAFGSLTGVPHNSAKAWADSMVLQYLDRFEESIPESEEDIYNGKPAAMKTIVETTAGAMRRLLGEAEAQESPSHLASPTSRTRPCGYVFKRGDIAWNCRTCQTDSTCVICDKCFRNSNHEGHEVYFHRTTPGGCCDCGDAEAWKINGCCDRHRPSKQLNDESINGDDPEDAVRMALKAQREAVETLTQHPTSLPPRFAAALGVVIGAAVKCLIDATDGAGIGADPIQWKIRWADEASRLQNGVCHNEDYSFQMPVVTPNSFVATVAPQNLPNGYKLHLRLHNDDVHTFDEVIEALHDQRHRHRNSPNSEEQQPQSLVANRDSATDMTHRVDSDGQVTVKSYSNIPAAMQGFRRLKSRGLHCAVVGTTQMHLEQRARALSSWLSEISSAHPAAAALVVHALVQVSTNHELAKVRVWQEARMIPPWVALGQTDEVEACRRRFHAFPPHLESSYLTREEAERLYEMGRMLNPTAFLELTGTDPGFYLKVPYRLPHERYWKSPHSLWGTLPSMYADPVPPASKHMFLNRLVTGYLDPKIENRLTETVHVVDTDLRKQQEAERITSSVYTHKLPGLHIVSGAGTVRADAISISRPPLPSPMEWRHLLATSSFRAPASPILLLLLLDPYPTKQLRGAIHSLFLSLLTDSRFKSRFAAALGVSYRPLSTLFCAGVGTEADTPLGFTVQIFTAGSLVRALGCAPVAEKLLLSDRMDGTEQQEGASVGVFTSPLAHTIVRCIHTNILGATKEVNMILNNTLPANHDDSEDEKAQLGNDALLPALTYVAGEHPLMTQLPAAPDDGFLDSRSTRHKRLPHLLRDLEYVIETPGTAIRLLLPRSFPVYQGPALSFRGEDVLTFPAVFARLLRVAQGMDPQKRKISGGHVEYELNRWLEAFGLSLNFAGTRDALAESPTNSNSVSLAPVSEDGSHLAGIREAMGNLIAAILREMKLWLYREGMLETGLPVPPAGTHGAMDLSQVEALQRSTLHVSGAQLGMATATPGVTEATASALTNVSTIALSCATGVKMTEDQLNLIESALRIAGAQRLYRAVQGQQRLGTPQPTVTCPVMGDWLRVPHSPLAGDSLSFHLPLHRALAKSVRSMCSVVVPKSFRLANPREWWKLPVLDDVYANSQADSNTVSHHHPLVPLIRPTLRSSNCRVMWSAGPDCSPQEAQRRSSRSRTVSANIAVAKIIHSLADHPIRCLAAAQQIERHLWARNGSSAAGMALNYSSTPLCRSFRDLDLTLVQLSAAGLSVGLGARRIFALLISRFSMDGYLCDLERRNQSIGSNSPGYSSGTGGWVNPPRLQDADHAIVLSESFFATLCVVVTEMPPPPPLQTNDDSWLRQSIRRELLHALVAEPRSHSEAMAAASCAVSRRDESDGSVASSGGGGLFREAFTEVLREIGKQKNQGSSRVASGPPAFELKAEFCDEYDPTFFHLRRQEHQHAMDIVARLRKQKSGVKDGKDPYCLPLVCPPPKAHPRFLPCRLLLHLPLMDAAMRRSLLFALTGGSWLPPAEPKLDKLSDISTSPEIGSSPNMVASLAQSSQGNTNIDIPVLAFGRRVLNGPPSSSIFLKRTMSDGDNSTPFSPEVVAASSVSFLEVLQLLTLQVHTLEECASLHRTQPDLDDEAKSLSFGLSINSYLGRLVHIPESLVDVWSLRPYPDGPLKSHGSGNNRGSILGLLIALYEHRSDHGADNQSGGSTEYGQGSDEHGGARTLASSGLKWLLRFVNSLVDGAPSVGAAVKSAKTGIPIVKASVISPASGESGTFWTIDDNVHNTIKGMLANLSELWPEDRDRSSSEVKEKTKNKEARKAAQMRVMEMMKRKQKAFAATIAPSAESIGSKIGANDETDLCIICRCDDADGENNGPLGYLGHVQRSRVSQMRSSCEAVNRIDIDPISRDLLETYRVVGHMGCQVRETEAMDSKPLSCLPRGSIVTVMKSSVSESYDILSRRVLVKHLSNPGTGSEVVTEGWASVESSQGYVILSPLVSLCYSNSRWGSTRPIIRQCGHAAHLKCVETHTLSLHQRAAGEQPYDGRFAANIDDGEFLCPLCKQLSNILIPKDAHTNKDMKSNQNSMITQEQVTINGLSRNTDKTTETVLTKLLVRGTRLTKTKLGRLDDIGQKALKDFGAHLLQAMDVPWERNMGSRKRNQRRWHAAIQRWDYEEEDDETSVASTRPSVKSVLRLIRQQHIAWAAVGHSAAASEASTRGQEDILPFGTFSRTVDPWSEYNVESKDKHPMLLELKRTLTGSAGLFEVLVVEIAKQLSIGKEAVDILDEQSIVGACLADIIIGKSWFAKLKSTGLDASNRSMLSLWSQLTSLMSSMPSHVSRDGIISQRSEARATATAMWLVRGLGTQHNISGEPPVPLAISSFQAKAFGMNEIAPDWGTLNPFTPNADHTNQNAFTLPFRPGVACAFLYTPLLAWDLSTYAGAMFSSLLVNDVGDLPNSEEILQIVRLLLLSRIIQSIITPGGFVLVNDVEEEDIEDWSADETEIQGSFLSKLVSHCRNMVKTRSLDAETNLLEENDESEPAALFSAIGMAILPFARSVLLMLRAYSAVFRERQLHNVQPLSNETDADKILNTVIYDSDIFSFENGFSILKSLKGPLPFDAIDTSKLWWSFINRWLVAIIGFEVHQGSINNDIFSGKFSTESVNIDKTDVGNVNTVEPSSQFSQRISEACVEAKHDPISLERNVSSADSDVGFALLPQTGVNYHLDEGMDVTDDNGQTESGSDLYATYLNNITAAGVAGDESDEDVMEGIELDDAEELVVGFNDDVLAGNESLSVGRQSGASDGGGDSSEDNSSSASEGESRSSDKDFAYVSRSPILSYQPSMLALNKISAVRQGTFFETERASAVMSDRSHLGLIHRRDIPTFSLVRLPKSFVELYSIVSKVKGRDETTQMDDSDDVCCSETAICLLTGAVMRSGSPRRSMSRTNRPPGACTLHARKNGSGIGIFFLVQKCTVLLMHNNKSAYSASLYVDEHGEEDPGLRRGRPLFLNDARYRALETLWRQQGVPREVAQIRSTSDRVIRDNWY